MKPYYKNIEKDDFCKMLKFIMIWQEKIALITTNKGVEKTFPQCGAKFDSLFKPVNMIKKENDELKNIMVVHNNHFYYKRHYTRMLSFLYHLRNAIAHGQIEGNGKYYIVFDFKDKAQTNPSAKGIVEKEIVHSVINLFV